MASVNKSSSSDVTVLAGGLQKSSTAGNGLAEQEAESSSSADRVPLARVEDELDLPPTSALKGGARYVAITATSGPSTADIETRPSRSSSNASSGRRLRRHSTSQMSDGKSRQEIIYVCVR